jgi:flagellar basal-body rod modification protein FlgD
MSAIPGTGNSSATNPTGTDAYNDLQMEDFLKLMIAELQNQDPLNPMDNSELVGQISQMREITATDKMTETLDSVLLGQNISSATNLIGAEIDAISDDNQRVTGLVDRVSVADGQPKLHLDLNPKATVDDDEGEVGAGEYEYRIVWQNDKGESFAVDPLATTESKKLKVEEDGSSVLLSNLPETTTTKQIFRRVAGTEDFHLVGQITDTKKSTFVDNTATEDLSNLVLSGTPQEIKPQRTFIVSLKNVGEIRPPAL